MKRARKSFSPDEIRWYVNHGDDAYTSKLQKRLGIEGDTGASLRQVTKLDAQKIPQDDIHYYVDNGVSLKLVSFLAKRGAKPKDIKTAIQVYGTGQTVAAGAGLHDDIQDWCGQNSTSSPICY